MIFSAFEMKFYNSHDGGTSQDPKTFETKLEDTVIQNIHKFTWGVQGGGSAPWKTLSRGSGGRERPREILVF